MTRMRQSRRASRTSIVRSATRPRVAGDHTTGDENAKQGSPLVGASLTSKPALETARRIAESVIIAAVSSAGLYLVGSVYTDAYYRRLAIEVTSLDLAPPYVALQSVHAL
jgi:hypothetical protein